MDAEEFNISFPRLAAGCRIEDDKSVQKLREKALKRYQYPSFKNSIKQGTKAEHTNWEEY